MTNMTPDDEARVRALDQARRRERNLRALAALLVSLFLVAVVVIVVTNS